jgi:hypothetical protein
VGGKTVSKKELINVEIKSDESGKFNQEPHYRFTAYSERVRSNRKEMEGKHLPKVK